MKSRKPDRIYWSCCQQGCGTRATTVDGRLTKHTDNHTHPPNNVDNYIRNIMGDIRKRCRDELTPIPTIYEEEIANIRGKDWDEETEQVARHIPTFQTCKTALYKERSKLRPVLPTSTANIQLEGEWTQTTAGGEFLQINIDENNKMLVFATRTGLQHLCAANTIYADGTFYTCPSLFHQLFTLHGFIDGEMYPLVFAFLPGKSTDVYVTFFSQLKQKCEEYGFELQPETVFLDHEVASRNGAQRVFPDTNVKACFFHYTQCVWRKVQALGLSTAYKENDTIHRLVRRASVLPLVPIAEVEDIWFQALVAIGEEDLPASVTAFTDYVTEQWVEGDKPLWNHYTTVGPRTTNHCEGWHSKLKKAVRHAHPNIFGIISILQRIEAACYIRVLQYQAGGVRPVKKRKYRQLEQRLAALKTRLENGDMTAMEYSDAASQLLHLK